MKTLIKNLFLVFLVIFSIGGTLLVAGQLLGIIIQDGDLMVKSTDLFGEPTYICASIAGALGFIYSYFPKDKKA